jgi:hypothetical protein
MDFMDANRMTRAPHRPNSPDLARSDFFLFGDVKRQLSECSVDDSDDMFTALHEILDGFEKRAFQGFRRMGEETRTMY